MMSLLSDAAPVSSPLALAKHHYNQALELEKQLRTLLQVKGPFDSTVRSLQNSLREKYELVILEDHELAELHEVEQAVWRLHYKQIDEFRAKIKKINYAVATNKSGAQRDSVLKILAAFKSFLAEVTGFYHNLILKLRAKNGLPQDYSTFETSSDTIFTGGDDNERRLRVKRCQLSCHRCLIFLGDLARYKEVHGNGQDTRSIDFSVAAGYYLQATSLWPSSGNPHNQLAVLATYVGDELLAVYRYFRSLAVETPFLTARDNLILLFEKNRIQYSQLHASKNAVPGAGSQVSPTGRGDRNPPNGRGTTTKLAKKEVKSENADVVANPPKSAELRRNFQIRFVRMNGILFTRTSLETFSQVYLETLRDLEQLLAGNDAILEAGLGTDHQSRTTMGNAGPSCVIQLVAILIFTVHNINWSADGAASQPTYAEILQRSDLFHHALTAAFEFAGRLMHRCSQSKDPSRSVLLPALLVFMEWLAGRPEMAIGSEVDVDQANARAAFWAECLVLLNVFLKTFKEESNGFEGITGAVENERGVALWEDFELQGFIPLAPAQTALNYSKAGSREGKGEKQFKVRIKRLLAAGKAVANALESTQRGICYDEELDRFILAGEARQEQKEEEQVGIGIEDISLEEEKNDSVGITSQSSFLTSDSHLKGDSLTKEISEEEDEEVIVFKPLSKDRPPASEVVPGPSSEVPAFNFSAVPTSEVSVQTTSMPSRNPWLPESLVDVSVGATKFQGPFYMSPGVPVQYSAVQGVSYPLDASAAMASSKSGFVELATPMPLISVTRASTGSTTPLLHDAISTLHLSGGLNSLGNHEASVTRSRDFPGNWLDQYNTDAPQYSTSASSDNTWFQGQKGVFTNFPDKRVVVASQSQNGSRSLWSSDWEPLDNNRPAWSDTKSSLAAITAAVTEGGNRGGGVSGFISSGTPNGEILLNPLLTSSEASSGFESGKYSMGSNRDAVTATPTSSASWSVKDLPVPTRVSQPAMRPPPGFGPLPGKSVAKPTLGTSQGLYQPPSAFQSPRPSIGEDNVDDYGWLDNFRSVVKPVSSSQSGYSGDSQSNSSSRSLWSVGDDISRSAGFDSAPFPFPGMGALHHRIFNTTVAPHIQAPQSPYSPESQLIYSERQKPIDEAQAQVQAQAQAQAELQRQQLMFLQRHQQQYQQQLPGKYHSRDPFVS